MWMVRCALVLAWVFSSSRAAASTAFRPAVAQRSSYGESFTLVADLDDGGYVQVSLGLTNIGPGSLKAVCRGISVPSDGKLWDAHTRVGRSEWSWADEGDGERLAIGPCSASVAGETTIVDVSIDGGTIHLVLAGRATRPTLSDATFALGGDIYRTEILLYRARVSGTISVPGASVRSVTGAGYLDHTRSTIKPRELADRWVRFRALRGRRGLLLLGRRALDGRFTPVWTCDAPGHCHHYPAFELDRSGDDRAPSFRVALADGDEPVEVRSEKLLYRDAPVEALGILGKLVAPFVGSPVTYVYRARLTENGLPPLDGILEVELAGE